MSKTKKVKSLQASTQSVSQDERTDRLELRGHVEEAMPGTLFKIRTEHENIVIATLSGKLRQNRIHILPGDNVTIEVSPYDLTRGRIVWRH
jgi:translation initiation factor IF-1